MATKYQHAIQEKHDLITEATGMLDAAEIAHRKLNANEETRQTAISKRLTVLGQEIVEMEIERDKERHSAPVGATTSAAALGTGKRARDLFGPPQSSGFESGEAFWAALHSGRADPRLQPAAAPNFSALQKEGIPSLGGFSVPEDLVMEMLDASLEGEVVRPRARVYGMSTATKKIAGFDGSTAAGGNIYGMSPQWLKEGGTIDEDTTSLRLVVLDAKKLALLPKASNELIADGVSFENQLSAAMVSGLGWGMDLAFLRGSGSGQPLGVLNASCLITVAKQGGQINDTIVIQNLVQMFARLHPSCVKNSVWVASPTTIPQLSTLALAVGTGGAPIPVMSDSSGEFKILTRPVIFSEKMAPIGDVGDILLADFSQYAIGLRKEVTVDKSIHVGFAQDISTYRAIARVDGMPLWASVYTPYAGDSLSPFVTLAAR